MRVPFSIPTRGHVTAALGRVYVARERVSVARVLVTAGVVLAGVFAVAEVAHWRSSHRRLGDYEGAGGHRARNAHLTGLTPTDSDQIIVVLGYANRGQRPNGINRFRVLAGLRSIDSRARSSLLIFCGGAVTGLTPEAVILERFAQEELGFTGRSVVETQSTTTWENIANAIPIIDRELTPATTISIVSNSHHAEKARDHLWQMRPDLARRLVRGGDYRFGEHPLVRPVAAVRGLLALDTLNRENARQARARD